METQKVGINNLKEILSVLARIIFAIDQAVEDKKFKLHEAIGIALKSIGLIKVVKSLKDAKAELLDLDLAEKNDLSEHFKIEFDLRNDEAEAMVESLVTMAIGLADNLQLLQGFAQKEASKTNKK